MLGVFSERHRLKKATRERNPVSWAALTESAGHTKISNSSRRTSTVAVAQLVRASDCGSEGRGFDSRQPPCFCSSISDAVPH